MEIVDAVTILIIGVAGALASAALARRAPLQTPLFFGLIGLLLVAVTLQVLPRPAEGTVVTTGGQPPSTVAAPPTTAPAGTPVAPTPTATPSPTPAPAQTSPAAAGATGQAAVTSLFDTGNDASRKAVTATDQLTAQLSCTGPVKWAFRPAQKFTSLVVSAQLDAGVQDVIAKVRLNVDGRQAGSAVLRPGAPPERLKQDLTTVDDLVLTTEREDPPAADCPPVVVRWTFTEATPV